MNQAARDGRGVQGLLQGVGHEARSGRDVGEIGDTELVRSLGPKRPVHALARAGRDLVATLVCWLRPRTARSSPISRTGRGPCSAPQRSLAADRTPEHRAPAGRASRLRSLGVHKVAEGARRGLGSSPREPGGCGDAARRRAAAAAGLWGHRAGARHGRRSAETRSAARRGRTRPVSTSFKAMLRTLVQLGRPGDAILFENGAVIDFPRFVNSSLATSSSASVTPG